MNEVKVDMVILDIMMPNMDGFDVCFELRKYYEIPILMLTAKGKRLKSKRISSWYG